MFLDLEWWQICFVAVMVFMGFLFTNYVIKKFNEARSQERYARLTQRVSANQETQYQELGLSNVQTGENVPIEENKSPTNRPRKQIALTFDKDKEENIHQDYRTQKEPVTSKSINSEGLEDIKEVSESTEDTVCIKHEKRASLINNTTVGQENNVLKNNIKDEKEHNAIKNNNTMMGEKSNGIKNSYTMVVEKNKTTKNSTTTPGQASNVIKASDTMVGKIIKNRATTPGKESDVSKTSNNIVGEKNNVTKNSTSDVEETNIEVKNSTVTSGEKSNLNLKNSNIMDKEENNFIKSFTTAFGEESKGLEKSNTIVGEKNNITKNSTTIIGEKNNVIKNSSTTPGEESNEIKNSKTMIEEKNYVIHNSITTLNQESNVIKNNKTMVGEKSNEANNKTVTPAEKSNLNLKDIITMDEEENNVIKITTTTPGEEGIEINNNNTLVKENNDVNDNTTTSGPSCVIKSNSTTAEEESAHIEKSNSKAGESNVIKKISDLTLYIISQEIERSNSLKIDPLESTIAQIIEKLVQNTIFLSSKDGYLQKTKTGNHTLKGSDKPGETLLQKNIDRNCYKSYELIRQIIEASERELHLTEASPGSNQYSDVPSKEYTRSTTCRAEYRPQLLEASHGISESPPGKNSNRFSEQRKTDIHIELPEVVEMPEYSENILAYLSNRTLSSDSQKIYPIESTIAQIVEKLIQNTVLLSNKDGLIQRTRAGNHTLQESDTQEEPLLTKHIDSCLKNNEVIRQIMAASEVDLQLVEASLSNNQNSGIPSKEYTYTTTRSADFCAQLPETSHGISEAYLKKNSNRVSEQIKTETHIELPQLVEMPDYSEKIMAYLSNRKLQLLSKEILPIENKAPFKNANIEILRGELDMDSVSQKSTNSTLINFKADKTPESAPPNHSKKKDNSTTIGLVMVDVAPKADYSVLHTTFADEIKEKVCNITSNAINVKNDALCQSSHVSLKSSIVDTKCSKTMNRNVQRDVIIKMALDDADPQTSTIKKKTRERLNDTSENDHHRTWKSFWDKFLRLRRS